MSSEHDLQLASVRCLSILRRYRDGERTDEAKRLMVAEVEVVIGYLLELDLPEGMTERDLLGPVEINLLARYGHEAGHRLNLEFVEVFERSGMILVARKVSRSVSEA